MDTLPKKIIGMRNEDYHSHNDFDSRSFFMAVSRGGGAAQKWLDENHRIFEGSAATSLGSDFDFLVMGLCEGRDVESVLKLAPADALSSNGQRRGKAWEEFREQCEKNGQIACSEEHHFKLSRMVESLLRCPPARRCVEQTDETQVSVFFEYRGHRLKVRPDGCCSNPPEGTPYWWDLKTTSASWDDLYRSVFSYGYSEQEWLYVRGAMALGMDEFRMPFVFVHSTPPYDCQAFWLPVDVVEEAGRRMERLMEEVRLRRLTGEYLPASHGDITEMPIPQWARKQEEEVVL